MKMRLLVAVMFTRMRGGCSMSAWVVIVLLATWSTRSAASLRPLGAVVGLKMIIDCVEKNLQTSYRALPLYFSFPLWNHSLPARLTQFLHLTS